MSKSAREPTDLSDEYLDEDQPGSILRDFFTVAIVTSNAVGIGYLLTIFESHYLNQPKMAPWLLARASGITAYLLFWMLVMSGIFLSHPWKQRIKFLHPITRMRFHTLLAVFTLSFVALHIMTIILDSYANVGLLGAFLPLKSAYRPLPVALGTIGLYAGVLTGLSARLKIGYGKRGWLNVHRFSMISLILIWIHAVYAGTDSAALASMYFVTALLLIAFAYSRYSAVQKKREPTKQAN
ncbi:MAG: hypothetical protein HKL84_08510 [Acidimicrobiaceae bacterium]|nr:hypothetical protein [Acidimicrobiaceae bacterium]